MATDTDDLRQLRAALPSLLATAPCKCDRCDRPMRQLIQLDGWTGMQDHGDDYIMVPDADGDVLIAGCAQPEPQRSDTTVRIQVSAIAEVNDVVRIISKWVDELKANGLPVASPLPSAAELDVDPDDLPF